MNEEIGEIDYAPVISTRYGPDPAELRRATEMLVNAKNPVLYVGQGVHYAKAWPQLKQLAELLAKREKWVRGAPPMRARSGLGTSSTPAPFS